MPAWTAFGVKSSATVAATRSPSPPHPPRAASSASSASRRGIRRTASNPTGMQERGTAAHLAEFIGTLLLVFFITAVISVYVAEPSAANPNPFIDFSVIGLVQLLVLFVLIQTLAVVSGAHFNPAVTAAMTFLRQIKPVHPAWYVVMQLLGAWPARCSPRRSCSTRARRSTTARPPSATR